MKHSIPIMKTGACLILITVCILRLWDITSAYESDKDTMNDILQYVPQPPEIAVTLPVNSPVYTASEEAAVIPASPAQAETPAELPAQSAHTETPAANSPELPLSAAIDGLAPAASSQLQYTPLINPFITDLQDYINSEITAWLYIPGTKINYPVVQTDNNDFYLRHNIYKEDSTSGSIFADYRSAPDFAGISTVIYGHNMRNKSMFGSLPSYADPGFFTENRYGLLYTSSKTYTLELFAFIITSYNDEQIYANPASSAQLFDYAQETARLFIEPDGFDKFLTLSTCSYEFDGARIVVLASMYELDS